MSPGGAASLLALVAGVVGCGALLFASARRGFAVLEVSPDGWSYRFEDDRAAPLYCCTAVGSGPCEPTSCG